MNVIALVTLGTNFTAPKSPNVSLGLQVQFHHLFHHPRSAENQFQDDSYAFVERTLLLLEQTVGRNSKCTTLCRFVCVLL